MKVLKLIFVVILVVKAIQTETLEVTGDDDDDEPNVNLAEEEVIRRQSGSLEYTDVADDNADAEDADDVEGRNLKVIELYTNDERCNNAGVCSGMDYGDKDVVVSFAYKMEVRFTSTTTYKIKEPTNYFTLSFVNSKFTNFPLQLFYSFKVQELDFRNCSLESLKWDNFLGADNLTILLLSENRLPEIKPSLFSLAESMSFLFLDSNQISTLYYDSFKGLGKLNFLDLHRNFIETLPAEIFSYLPALQQINLGENRIQFIHENLFSDTPRLFSIHLQHNDLNEIRDYAFEKQSILKFLDLSHNSNLKVLVLANIRVENLWAKNCSINRVNVYGQAVHVDLQQNFIKELFFSQPEYLETLRLKDNALEQIASLSLSTNLRSLDVSNNPELEALPDLLQINSLERLDLSNTSLREIPKSLLLTSNKLRSLNVSYNQIEEINPLYFKYLEKLSQLYIHHNNWNCYNLKMLMDVLIKPLKISYTRDAFDDDDFPGEYIHGIKCMYRLEQANAQYYVDSVSAAQTIDIAPSTQQEQEDNQLKWENTKKVEELRHELKTIVGIYEQKFAFVLNKLNDLDLRLKKFEVFNQTMWQHVAIVV